MINSRHSNFVEALEALVMKTMTIPRADENGAVDYRCEQCDKLLAKGEWQLATIQIKCNRCGKINSFFDKNKDQVVITDSDGKILFVNQAMSDLNGFEVSDMIGKTPSLWGGQMPREFYQDLWHRIKDLKEVVVVRVTNKKRNGDLYDAVLRISPILDELGQPKFFLGIETEVLKLNKEYR